MSQQVNPQQSLDSEEEIELGSIVAKIKGAIIYVLKRWYILLGGAVVCAGLGAGISVWYGKKYVSTATFGVQVQNQSTALLSSALSLASSLGIGTKTGGGASYDNNFFATIMQSRRIVKQTFLQNVSYKNKKDLLVNDYIDIMELRDDWEDIPKLKNFKFTHTDLNDLNPLEDSMMSVINDMILDKNLAVTYDEASPLNTATFTSPDKDFSRIAMSQLLESTSGYYMKDVYKLNLDNLDLAKYRLDSIGGALKALDNKVASLKDNTNNIIKQKGFLDLNQAIRDQSLMNIQYSSAVNNYELAKSTLLSNTPILQIVDDPQFSTQVSFIPMILAVIIGLILGLFLTGGGLILAAIVTKSIDTEKKKHAETVTDTQTAN